MNQRSGIIEPKVAAPFRRPPCRAVKDHICFDLDQRSRSSHQRSRSFVKDQDHWHDLDQLQDQDQDHYLVQINSTYLDLISYLDF